MSGAVHTVITAAGDSRPLFLGAGFEAPKNLILWEGTEVLVRAVNSYSQDFSRTHVALNRDECTEWPTESRLQSQCPGVETALVSSSAPGALVSAVVALGAVPADAPLVVAAGDSHIEGGIGHFLSDFLNSDSDAATVVFSSSNPRWSYVSPGPTGHVRQVAEKRVIGPLATTGVFMFRNSETFRRAAEWCLVNNARDRGLFYVSTTLNYLVREGLTVTYAEIPRSLYRSWSLPIDFVQQSG